MADAMLDHGSDRWKQLTSAGGTSANLVPQLIRSLEEHPLDEDWAEVWEQVAHQWTLHSSGYAALPHLLRLRIRQGLDTNPDFLLDLGRVAAPLEKVGEYPKDLKPAFERALREAARIALRAAKGSKSNPTDYNKWVRGVK
jgi:hypothetical protein